MAPTPGTLRAAAGTPKDKIRSDFRNFLYLVWQQFIGRDPTPIQYDMAAYLQGGPDRLMVKAFRGVGKSYVSAAFVVWCLLNDPNLNIIIYSASKTRSDAFTTFCLRLIDEMPMLMHLRPRENQRRSMVCFDVGPARASQTPSVLSTGIFGNATGFRADIIIPDDIEVPNNSETVLQAEKLWGRRTEFDAILKPGGRIIYLGTDQTETSMYRRLPELGYEVRIWPVRIDSTEELNMYGDQLAPYIRNLVETTQCFGRSLEPTRFTDEDLVKRELAYGRAGFALQFKLDPRLSDMELYPLKIKDLMVHPLDSELVPEQLIWCGSHEHYAKHLDGYATGMKGDCWYTALLKPNAAHVPFTGTVMAIDPAGRGKDETGYAIVSCCNSLLYLRASGGFKGYDEATTLEPLARLCKRYKVNKIIVEPNFGDGMFNTLLAPVMKKIHPCSIEDSERSSAQKEKRIIDTLEPVMSSHRLVVDQAVVQSDYESTLKLPLEQQRVYRLFYQLTRITRERGCLKHDDRVDALALAVGYWQKAIGRDVGSAVEASRARLMDEELKKFAKNVLGRKPRKNTWLGHMVA